MSSTCFKICEFHLFLAETTQWIEFHFSYFVSPLFFISSWVSCRRWAQQKRPLRCLAKHRIRNASKSQEILLKKICIVKLEILQLFCHKKPNLVEFFQTFELKFNCNFWCRTRLVEWFSNVVIFHHIVVVLYSKWVLGFDKFFSSGRRLHWILFLVGNLWVLQTKQWLLSPS